MSSCADCHHTASSGASTTAEPAVLAYPPATLEEAVATTARRVKIAGAAGTGKTEVLVRKAAELVRSGADPASILVVANTADAAEALATRIRQAEGSTASVTVATIRTVCTDLLNAPEAREATGRVPRLLNNAEYNVLLEDLKTLGQRPGRLKSMLTFFYYQWSQLEPEEEWLLPAEENGVRRALDSHLRLRGAMLLEELSPVAVAYLQSEAGARACGSYATVLVDDYQNLSRASQTVCDLIAGETLIVTGNENQAVTLRDPHPFAAGFTCFEQHRPDAVCVQLTANVRCSEPVAAMGNALIRYGSMSGERAVVGLEDIDSSRPTLIKWTVPDDEFPGIALYLKRLLGANDDLDPNDVYLVAPNKTWAKTLRRALSRRGIDSCVAMSAQPLAGDPRSLDRAGALVAYTKLNLLANPRDVVAWRSWCAFDDYLCYGGAWCRLEAWAQERQLGLVDALAALADEKEPAFLEAEVLAEHYRTGSEFIEKNARKTGFALAKALVDADKASDFAELLEPIEGDEEAAVLYRRAAEAVLDPRFGTVTREVRIGSFENLQGLNPRVLVMTGMVDGFMPSRDCFDVAVLEEERDKKLDAQRRVFYNAVTKASSRLVLSTLQKADLETAERLKMEVRRIKMERGERFAMLSPSAFIAECGDSVPGAVSGEQFLSEL